MTPAHILLTLLASPLLLLGPNAGTSSLQRNLPATQATVLAAQDIGQAAHYIVFQRLPDGTFKPLFYCAVQLSAPLEGLGLAQVQSCLAEADREAEPLVVALQADGQTVYQNVVEIPRWLRGEFRTSETDASIEGHLVPDQAPVFVVRVPAVNGSTLVLRDEQFSLVAQFDPMRLRDETPGINLRVLEAHSIPLQATGDPRNRLDLLIMGDGYTADQATKFEADAATVAERFLGLSPFAEYRNYVNISALFTASRHSGADHPPYVPGCNQPQCCGDADMKNDPLQGTMVDTAFDCSFCRANIHRLLAGNTDKVLAAAAAVPDWDQILLIVNDTTYGGSGGTLATFSMHSAAVQLAQHEYSHSFTRLADEYGDPYPGYPGCSDSHGPPCEPNVTDVRVRAQIKWSPWISPTTPIPTEPQYDPIYATMVGLFEGARYQPTGMFRPKQGCLMRTLDQPWCEICSQAYILRLYRGGWGVPAGGIRLIEPGSTLPATSTVTLVFPGTQVFRANILQPVGGPPIRVRWLLNNTPIPNATTNVYTLTTRVDQLGPLQLSLVAEDTTPLVHPAMNGGLLQCVNTWTVRVVSPSISIVAKPQRVLANGLHSSVITATVTDEAHAPVPSALVSLTSTLGLLEPLSALANGQGVVTSTLRSTEVGTATVTASAGAASASVQVEFLPAHVVLRAEPGIIPADAGSTSLIRATVTDGNDQPVPGRTVQLATTLGSLAPRSGTTDAGGVVTSTLTSSAMPGFATVTATCGLASGSVRVRFGSPTLLLYLPAVRRAAARAPGADLVAWQARRDLYRSAR